ncbi:hypothetical protein CHARACLAT_021262 [Characodon lateralis]|uniref:Uncharacterized protein n=1 Tax=Characodon lateralis TaxID=208331 RepID=A0ABU7EX30_9TELE|nr:hypothetical protein [Characodon lateralis]
MTAVQETRSTQTVLAASLGGQSSPEGKVFCPSPSNVDVEKSSGQFGVASGPNVHLFRLWENVRVLRKNQHMQRENMHRPCRKTLTGTHSQDPLAAKK